MKDRDSLSLLGFLLPGIIHEFRNVLNRISLLAQHGLQEGNHELTGSNADRAGGSRKRTNGRHITLENIAKQVDIADSTVIEVLGRFIDESEKPLRTPDDASLFFRVLRSSCKHRGAELRTGEISPETICEHGRYVCLLLMEICLAMCQPGVRIGMEFPKHAAEGGESDNPSLRLVIGLSDEIEAGSLSDLENRIDTIIGRNRDEGGSIVRRIGNAGTARPDVAEESPSYLRQPVKQPQTTHQIVVLIEAGTKKTGDD